MDYQFNFIRSMDGFPKVFRECECKSKKDPSQSIKIRIQEVPETLFEDIVEFMVKYYLSDEPLARSTNVIGEEDSLETYKAIFYLCLVQNLSIVALHGDEIVGVQLYTVFTLTDDPLPEMPGKAIGILRRFLYEIKTVEIIGSLDVFQHLQDWGLCVHPQYRGWGVGEQILRSANDLGVHIGIRTIITIFTVINSQVLAERIGYKTLNSLKYKEYKDEVEDTLAFPGEEETEEIKLMMLTF